MDYTNFTYDFKGVIDYIFYSADFLTPLGADGPSEHGVGQRVEGHWLPQPSLSL
jgi:CCR4-NOT transcription complex subunit 6